MAKAIRHPDGRMITTSEWNAIRVSARMIKNELRQLPASQHRAAKGRRKTKMYYRTYHFKEWMDAIRKLEGEQPLLALCAFNWKADHVLGAALLADNPRNEIDDDVALTKNQTGFTARKQTKRNKKRRENGKEDATSNVQPVAPGKCMPVEFNRQFTGFSSSQLL
jgi:hypothetical protein